MRFPLTVFASLVLLAAFASSAGADDERVAFTSYEAGPLSDAGLVVVGRTVEMSSKRAQQIAWVEIDQVLLGTADTDERLLVYGYGPHPTTDISSPLDSYFPSPDKGRHVFFLGVRADSIGADFRDAFEASGVVGEEKISAIAREIELSQIEDEDQRAAQTRAYLLDGLKAKGPWTRVHAARELRRFAVSCPERFTREAEGLVRALLRRPISKEQRVELRKLTLALERRSSTPTSEPRRPAGSAWKDAFESADAERRREMIEVLFDTDGSNRAIAAAWWAFGESDPGLRAVIVRRTAGLRARAFLKTLLEAYSSESSVDVRKEMVRAAGLMGGAEHVAWLEERSANPILVRTAWLALARVRTKDALAVLERAAAALEDGEDDADRRTAAWIRFLLSDAFPASDRAG